MIKSGHPDNAPHSAKARMNWQHFLDLIHRELASGFVATSVTGLLLAAILLGAIGLKTHHRLMQNVLTGETTNHIRLQFDVEGCAGEQRDLFRPLEASTVFSRAVSLGRVERE